MQLKSVLFSVVFIYCLQTNSSGQSITTPYSFCKVSVVNRYKKPDYIEVDYGRVSTVMGKIDFNPVDSALEYVNGLGNDVVMLNYMNSIGWELFSVLTISKAVQSPDSFIYYFRKPKPAK